MFLTISTTGTSERPATDLSFLLHKHPDRAQTFSTTHGTAHVFYPEATAERCTAALLLQVDPAALLKRGRAKGRDSSPDVALAHYVNDRPYAASSLLAVALSSVFRTALRGDCRTMPERAASPLPLRIEVPAVSARGGAELVKRLFEPLGWTAVTAEPVVLDEQFPEWGDSRYVQLTLEGEVRLSDALRQLYVLLPVLDGAKHYWVAPDEVDKLLRAGEGWLADHPERGLIALRYLSRRMRLTQQATERLELVRLADADDIEVESLDNAVEETPEADRLDTESGTDAHAQPDRATDMDTGPGAGGLDTAGVKVSGTPGEPATPGTAEAEAEAGGREPSLARQRRDAILGALESARAATVLDLGCGEGRLVQVLLKVPGITHVTGVDVSVRALAIAARKLKVDRMSERQAARVTLTQGALTYTDKRLAGRDAAVLSEVIEHLDLPRLPALEYAVFGAARPRTVVVTTPNAEYNVRWETLPAGHVRHADHRFEWRRSEFREWAERVALRHGYDVAFTSVGPEDPEVGAPTQMAVFTMTAKDAKDAKDAKETA
ncbi:3' terminal RNA ribose 2'-O-methyltransferase Hen1 [Streptomyces sp. NBC_01497]|uniref:3' terminal RNA ribose 2'-O-methyltransferase Hen1 n=1 Tax=Streptomyces sp. NBC_01497 TaxID=2903885 RepID=UPI002E37B825|nr:3' terminal RNA ribose 2'-O-methyltransferase Hen1 [Streptomyces sp. NBC_01497]